MKLKTQKGITLIALIITIIVMLILVGVTVTVALNGGLFTTAKKATGDTETERDKELALSDEQIEIDGEKYDSYQDYLDNNPIVEVELPQGWTIAEKPEGWSNKVTAITDGTYTIPLPYGYQVSLEQGEHTVTDGLVVTDGENEFVWIPIAANATFANPYISGSDYKEPTHHTEDYEEMITSVEKYDGFYIGRYETTKDGDNIGSKENTTILSCTSFNEYNLQMNANVKGNGDIVQTNMIWGQQWDAMITFFDNQNKDYSATTLATITTEGVQKSGQAKYTYNNETISDVICNIYDLRGNSEDTTAESVYRYLYDVDDGTGNPMPYYEYLSVYRGGHYYYDQLNNWRFPAYFRGDQNSPGYWGPGGATRLTLYIK